MNRSFHKGALLMTAVALLSLPVCEVAARGFGGGNSLQLQSGNFSRQGPAYSGGFSSRSRPQSGEHQQFQSGSRAQSAQGSMSANQQARQSSAQSNRQSLETTSSACV